MKISLIFPPNVFQTKMNMPPLGIAWLAAVLRENGYKDVSLIDSMANRYKREEIIDLLKKQNPDVIGVSFTTQIRFEALALIRMIRKDFPKALIVTGGPHPSLTSKDLLSNVPEVDVVVRGEGEVSFLNLIKAAEKGESFENVKGISFRNRKGEIVENLNEMMIQDLDTLPFPARDLLPMEKYELITALSKKGATTIMSSRGCPFQCVFCSTSKHWGHKIRQRSAQKVVDEIEYLVKTYPFIKGIRFFDDVFTVSKDRVMEVCREISKRNLGISWECEARVDTIDKELVEAMKNSGCEFIDLGVESGSNRILKNIKKGITVEQVIFAAKTIKEAGIEAKAFIMHGLPGETYEDIKKTVFLSRYLFYNLGIETTQTITAIYPHTEIERLAKEMGTFPKDFSWNKYYRNEKFYPPLTLDPHSPVFEQPDLTYEQIFKYVKRAKLAYFVRHPINFLKTFRKHRKTIKKWLITKA